MQLSLNRAAQSTIILFFFKVLIGQFLLSSLPTVTAQESAVPNCFACPESDAAGTPLDDMGTSRGAISCAYGSASCSYETVRLSFFLSPIELLIDMSIECRYSHRW